VLGSEVSYIHTYVHSFLQFQSAILLKNMEYDIPQPEILGHFCDMSVVAIVCIEVHIGIRNPNCYAQYDSFHIAHSYNSANLSSLNSISATDGIFRQLVCVQQHKFHPRKQLYLPFIWTSILLCKKQFHWWQNVARKAAFAHCAHIYHDFRRASFNNTHFQIREK